MPPGLKTLEQGVPHVRTLILIPLSNLNFVFFASCHTSDRGDNNELVAKRDQEKYLAFPTPSSLTIKMKLLSLIVALAGSGIAAAFLQPIEPPQLHQYLQHGKENKIGFLTGDKPSKSFPLHMVAIRSPFWNAFNSRDKELSSDEFIADRDFSVATTLMVVGIWLTCFGPSK